MLRLVPYSETGAILIFFYQNFQDPLDLWPQWDIEAVAQRYSVKKVFRPATLLKKRLWHRSFPVNFAKFLRTPFLTEHLRRLLLETELETPPIIFTYVLVTKSSHQWQSSTFSFRGMTNYNFASLFCKSKREDLRNKEKCLLFHFKSSFRSRVNQILTFHIFKCHDIIKCLHKKHETHFTE